MNIQTIVNMDVCVKEINVRTSMETLKLLMKFMICKEIDNEEEEL